MNSFEISRDFPNIAWDLMVHIFPGCVMLIFSTLIFKDILWDVWQRIIDKNLLIGVIVFFIISYFIGVTTNGISEIFISNRKKWSRGKIMYQLLKNSKCGDSRYLFLKTIKKSLDFNRNAIKDENSAEDLYFTCVQFIRFRDKKHYDLYVGRIYSITAMYFNLSIISIVIAILSLISKNWSLWPTSLGFAISFLFAAIVFINIAISDRKFMVSNVIRAVYLLSNNTEKNIEC